MKPFKRKKLPNGLQIEIFDETNRYFGDYHRVCLRVVMSLDLSAAAVNGPDDASFWAEAGSVFGGKLQVVKKLVRMAVPGVAVEQTALNLADEFFKLADDYLSRPDYPQRLARAELDARKRARRCY